MYKVKNKLNQRVKYKDLVFEPFEVKKMEEKPYSDKFDVETIESNEPKKIKGGK